MTPFAVYSFYSLYSHFEPLDDLSLNDINNKLCDLGYYNANMRDSYASLINSRGSLFVTWKKSGALRGCIGTFSKLPLGHAIREYSLIAAFKDRRFSPISLLELPRLSSQVTILKNFEVVDPFDWDIGKHGVEMEFEYRGIDYSSTFLPEVAVEQGWDHAETLQSLVEKAGCRDVDFREVENLRVTRYLGDKSTLSYNDFLVILQKLEHF